jgi:hypothetical protein
MAFTMDPELRKENHYSDIDLPLSSCFIRPYTEHSFFLRQMAGFVVQSKVSVLQLVGEALAGLQDVLGGKFGGHDRKGRAPEIPDSPELLALAANVFKAIEAYSNL